MVIFIIVVYFTSKFKQQISSQTKWGGIVLLAFNFDDNVQIGLLWSTNVQTVIPDLHEPHKSNHILAGITETASY